MSTAHQPPCLAAAHDYLQRGWSPIPLCPWDHAGVSGDHQTSCQTPGKRPYFEWKQYQDKRPAPAHLNLSWNRNQEFNVGICLGPVSGLIGLDIDGLDGEELLNDWRAGEIIPATLEFATPGGGRRLLFKHPPESVKIKSHQANQKEAIRILAKGAQTVAPPSRHPSGGFYVWIPGRAPGDIEPAECPDWLLHQLMAPEEKGQVVAYPPPTKKSTDVIARARAYLAVCDPAISQQGGHDTTIKIANRLVKGFALPEETALQLLLTEYNPRCQPPWSEKELRHKLADAAKSTAFNGYMLNGHEAIKKNAPSDPATFSAADLEHAQLPTPKFIIPNILPQGLSILAARPKIGKSWMALQIALAVATDCDTMGLTGFAHGAVLYLALEDTKRRIKSRLAKLLAGDPWPKELHFAREWPRIADKEGAVQHIRTWLDAHPQTQLVIIDTLPKIRPPYNGKQENKYQADYDMAHAIKAVADDYNIAILSVQHTRKAEAEDPVDTISGTLGAAGAADALLILKRIRNDDGPASMFVTGRDVEEDDLALEFSKETCLWSFQGKTSVVKPSHERQEIIQAIQEHGPMKPQDLAICLGKKYDNVRRVAWNMVRNGILIKNMDGEYCIPIN